MATQAAPGLAEIERARERLGGVARVTPVFPSETLSRLSGRPVHLKAENLQRTGSFKIRGAYSKLAGLEPEERAAGVVAASAGNHGQAVAWAARELGAKARIFMPQDSPMAKVDATRSYGAEVELTGPAIEESLAAARAYVDARAAPRSSTPSRIRRSSPGRGRSGSSWPSRTTSSTRSSSRSAAAGSRRASRSLCGRCVPACGSSACRLPARCPAAPASRSPTESRSRSRASSRRRSSARRSTRSSSVEDEQIAEAIVLLAERTKLVVEGAGAVGVAAILGGLVGGSGPAVAVLSGGNIDASLMVQVMRRGLALGGRYLVLRTRVLDRPGELARLLDLLAAERVNVVEVEHQREAAGVPVGHTGVELTLLTRDPAHCEQLVAQMREWGYPVERLD